MPNRLASLVKEKFLKGEEIADLTESNPTKCGFAYSNQEILTALASPNVLSYRPEPFGLLSARAAVVQYYAGLGIELDPQQIILTSSTSEAYSFIFKLLCNAGDEILVPCPSYPLFEYLCQLNDINPQYYHLEYDGEWRINFASIVEKISDLTKAVILVNPNNPTGSYIKQEEFNQINLTASEHNLSIISDEVFWPYCLLPGSNQMFLAGSNPSGLLFSINGISKLLGLPQLKLSWIIVQGKSGQKKEALNRLEIISDTYLSVNTPVQIALPKLLPCCMDIKNQIQKRIDSNFNFLQKMSAETGISALNVEGGWYAILQMPHRKSDEEWVDELLRIKNILVQPGHFYDLIKESCIVVSLLPIHKIFRDSIEIICDYVREN